MSQILIAPPLAEVEQIFFAGMLCGWAGGATPQEGIRPGHLMYKYQEGEYLLIDEFFISAYDDYTESSGDTLIYYQDNIVWRMHYGGLYEAEVLSFLQCALYEAYSNSNFFGGRGPLNFEDKVKHPHLSYVNYVKPRSNFAYAQGRDYIYDRQLRRERGFHEFWCRAAFRPQP